ncbi:MAG: hypothetical protein L0212_01020, partial [Acidobacteria bacterium]|nr:hypothetical protein [Acidobacteriota bacterium]
MRIAVATAVVFLFVFVFHHVQPTGVRPWMSLGWTQDKPAAEAAGLNMMTMVSSGHGFSRAVSAQEKEGASAPEVSPRSEAELERAVRAQPDDWALHVELIEASAAANHLSERQRWYQAWLA